MRRLLSTNRIRWSVLATALTIGVSLAAASGAQAVVVNDLGTVVGVAPVPGTASKLPSAMISTASASPCDPVLAVTPYMAFLPGSNPLCSRGGSVLTSNETFAVTWDPYRRYWAGTRGYLEQFLRDVADGSGTLSSPYAVTSQYTSAGARAANASRFGGGCIDYGNPTNSSNTNTTCQFGNSVQTGPGDNYPPSGGCTPSGNSWDYGSYANDTCVTDAQIRQELTSVIGNTDMLDHAAGQNPVVVMLLPPGVETCLDINQTICSANSNSTAVTAQFCSYHGQLMIGSAPGREVEYVVQPWTPYTACDEPKLPALPTGATPQQIATDAGSRMVSPLSQGQIAAIVNPGLDGWVANDGAEINDDGGCVPEGADVDTVPVGSHSYALQREFSNSGAISLDPNDYFGCVPSVMLSPAFVVPSAVSPGDDVVFDGSTTASTLLVPNDSYHWDFGDGSSASGPSVVHSYALGGNYTVTLTVTDRGGNVGTIAQQVQVLGANGQPVPTPPGGSSNGGGSNPGFSVQLHITPQSLRSVLSSGISVRVTSNQAADGIARVYIPRSAATRAHLSAGRGPSVQIGIGMIQVKAGTATLHVRLSRATTAKLRKLKRVTMTVRFALVAKGGSHMTIVEAGQY